MTTIVQNLDNEFSTYILCNTTQVTLNSHIINITDNVQDLSNMFKYIKDNNIVMTRTIVLETNLYMGFMLITNYLQNHQEYTDQFIISLLGKYLIMLGYFHDQIIQVLDRTIKNNNMQLTGEELFNFLSRIPLNFCNYNCDSILLAIYLYNKDLFEAIVLANNDNKLDMADIYLYFKPSYNHNAVIISNYDNYDNTFKYAHIYKMLYGYRKFDTSIIYIYLDDDNICGELSEEHKKFNELFGVSQGKLTKPAIK